VYHAGLIVRQFFETQSHLQSEILFLPCQSLVLFGRVNCVSSGCQRLNSQKPAFCFEYDLRRGALNMDAQSPFAFVNLTEKRSHKKPRKTGLTMMADFGLPLGAVADVLDMAHRYIDLAKIAVGTSRLYDSHYLQKKLKLYKARGIRPFIGGQFLEYVFAEFGDRALPKFFKEARRIGFEVVEVSDNCLPFSDNERRKIIRIGLDNGLAIFGEVGSKNSRNAAAKLVKQAEICVEAGAELVLVEAAELISRGRLNMRMVDAFIRALGMQRILIELPGTWITGVSLSMIEDMKKTLVQALGPDVNLANVMPQDVMETEALRVGLGVVGPTKRKSGVPA
jgi:phosphosulfolactate synthase